MKFKLKYKILFLILILLFTIFVILLPIVISNTKKILFNNLINRGRGLVTSFALSCENLLVTSDELALEELVDVTLKEKDVLQVYVILNKDLTYYLHNDRKLLGKKYQIPKDYKIFYGSTYNVIKTPNEDIYQFFYPIKKIYYKKEAYYENFGTAYIEMTTKSIYKNLNILKLKIFLIFFGVFLFSILSTIFVSHLIVSPIKKLEEGINIIGSGNLRFRIKISTRDEIEHLSNEFNKMTARLYRLQKEIVKKKIYEKEIEIARFIQKDIILKKPEKIDNYDLILIDKPAREIGGDYYSIINSDSKKKNIIIADISGKGIPAALLMSIFHTIVNIFGKSYKSPEEFIKKIAEILYNYFKKGNFITSIIGTLDLNLNKFEFVSAGHEAPILISNKIEFIKTKGIPIGILNYENFLNEIKLNEIFLKKNDILILYTDGIRNFKKKVLDDKNLLKFFENLFNYSNSDFFKFTERLKEEIHSKKFSDDITILALRRK